MSESQAGDFQMDGAEFLQEMEGSRRRGYAQGYADAKAEAMTDEPQCAGDEERVAMQVTFRVTKAQALALEAMFHYWNQLASWGSSRNVAYFVDGDGNFKPKCTIKYSQPMPALTDEMIKAAVVADRNGERVYDFDGVAWMLRRA